MLHLNKNDDRENSLENFRELAENSNQDIFVTYHDEEYILYNDPKNATIEMPDGDFLQFKDFDEMIQAPVFEGKSLIEIIDEIDATY